MGDSEDDENYSCRKVQAPTTTRCSSLGWQQRHHDHGLHDEQQKHDRRDPQPLSAGTRAASCKQAVREVISAASILIRSHNVLQQSNCGADTSVQGQEIFLRCAGRRFREDWTGQVAVLADSSCCSIHSNCRRMVFSVRDFSLIASRRSRPISIIPWSSLGRVPKCLAPIEARTLCRSMSCLISASVNPSS